MLFSCRSMASDSGWEASAFMKIDSSTLPFHCTVARSTPRFTSRAPPTSVNETATVRRAADAIETFRLRLDTVSRKTYSRFTATRRSLRESGSPAGLGPRRQQRAWSEGPGCPLQRSSVDPVDPAGLVAHDD